MGIMLSREEILTIYAQGPEAVVDLVEKLLTSQAELVQQIQTLTARVQELETRLNKDSHNSHKVMAWQNCHGGAAGACAVARLRAGSRATRARPWCRSSIRMRSWRIAWLSASSAGRVWRALRS